MNVKDLCSKSYSWMWKALVLVLASFAWFYLLEHLAHSSTLQLDHPKDRLGLRSDRTVLQDLRDIEEEKHDELRSDQSIRLPPGVLNEADLLPKLSNKTASPPPGCAKVHVFYYSWWGSPNGSIENEYVHWNHQVLPHWDQTVNNRLKHLIGTSHRPPLDIASSYYPQLGPYSSSHPKTIALHVKQMRQAGIGVLVLSWYPPGLADGNGRPELADLLAARLLDACRKESIQLAFHIEPYQGRTAQSVWQDAEYLSLRYGGHPAFAKIQDQPLLYVYDSYLIAADDWAKVARERKRNSCAFGLVVEKQHLEQLASTRFFCGLYTYFAATNFVWGSTRSSWKHIVDFARQRGLLTSISIGPGYQDTKIRPWNDVNTRKRLQGRYYQDSFLAAEQAGSDVLSLTSWNEWHEGTQIEPAIPFQGYSDYTDLGGPDSYLLKTRAMVDNSGFNCTL